MVKGFFAKEEELEQYINTPAYKVIKKKEYDQIVTILKEIYEYHSCRCANEKWPNRCFIPTKKVVKYF